MAEAPSYLETDPNDKHRPKAPRDLAPAVSTAPAAARSGPPPGGTIRRDAKEDTLTQKSLVSDGFPQNPKNRINKKKTRTPSRTTADTCQNKTSQKEIPLRVRQESNFQAF